MTPPFDDVPWDRLAAHLAGALPPVEEEQLLAWVNEDPARQELLASLRKVWTGSAAARQQWGDAEEMLQAIKAEATEPVRVLQLSSQSKGFAARVSFTRRALIAAALAGVIVGGWLLLRAVRTGSAPLAATAFQEFRAQRGQRLALRLPDGSSVMLGPTSALRFPKAYGTRDRVVELEGEGYFNVTHDATRPFAVRTRQLTVHDVGTRFGIRAYDGDLTTRVVVAEGKVVLEASYSSPLSRRERGPGGEDTTGRGGTRVGPVLVAGELGVASASGAITVRRGINAERYLAWTEGRLEFEGARLADVVTELNRWYDVDIRLVGPGLGGRLLTARFRDDQITKVLSLIGASLDLEVSGGGRQFTLAARAAEAAKAARR